MVFFFAAQGRGRQRRRKAPDWDQLLRWNRLSLALHRKADDGGVWLLVALGTLEGIVEW